MCKILALTNAQKVKRNHINKIGQMLLGLERDGFGYAIQGEKGVYGEKCISKHFETRIGAGGVIHLPFVKRDFESFGLPKDKPKGPAIFHGRTSTNQPGLINTHPMQEDGWHLIHNGVVTDHGPAYEKKTANDSEHVLHRLIKGIDEVAKHLSGYYAFAAIDPKGRLHIAKDKTANLNAAWSKDLDSFIIGTNPELIKSAAKILGVKVGPVDSIKDEEYCIFKGNQMQYRTTFKSRGYTYTESQYATSSLGYGLYDNSYLNSSRSTSGGYQAHKKNETNGNTWAESITTTATTEKSTDDKEAKTYRDYMEELTDLDESYTIYDKTGVELKLQDFWKLDWGSQVECTVVRPDGTVVGYQI
jgi:predicted glutamine amidotransferase